MCPLDGGRGKDRRFSYSSEHLLPSDVFQVGREEVDRGEGEQHECEDEEPLQNFPRPRESVAEVEPAREARKLAPATMLIAPKRYRYSERRPFLDQ